MQFFDSGLLSKKKSKNSDKTARPDQISLNERLSFRELKVWAFGYLSFESYENQKTGFWEILSFAKLIFSQKSFQEIFFPSLLVLVRGVLSQKMRKIDFTILELLLKNPQKPGFSHFLVFWHFWYTLMTREGSGWLDINFSMSEPTPRSFVKIWAPLPQKCSVLSEYSH